MFFVMLFATVFGYGVHAHTCQCNKQQIQHQTSVNFQNQTASELLRSRKDDGGDTPFVVCACGC